MRSKILKVDEEYYQLWILDPATDSWEFFEMKPKYQDIWELSQRLYKYFNVKCDQAHNEVIIRMT
jgi:hypothetical protein